MCASLSVVLHLCVSECVQAYTVTPVLVNVCKHYSVTPVCVSECVQAYSVTPVCVSECLVMEPTYSIKLKLEMVVFLWGVFCVWVGGGGGG